MTASRFSTDVYAQRLRAATAAAADAGLAGLVITPGHDLRYLVGSRAQTFERLTALKKRYADVAECYRLLARECERLIATHVIATDMPPASS